jgi:hypothetical protein
MKEWGRRREGGRGSCTAAPPAGAAEGRRRAAGPPRRCPACRRGRLRRGSCAWPLRSRSSPSQGRRRPSRSRPWSSRHRGIGAGPAGDGVVLLCFPCSKPSSQSSSSAPPRLLRCRVQEHKVSLNPFTLLWTRPSSRGWTEPCELAVCCPLPARATAQTRRRLRAGHRAEPVALQVPLPSSPRALPCLAIVSYLCSDERTLSPARCRHPHAEHTTVEQRPCLSWARSRVSTDPCRVHSPACRHPVSVPLSCAYCRHCAIATAVPPTCCLHTPPPGRGPVLPGQTCARALTHT